MADNSLMTPPRPSVAEEVVERPVGGDRRSSIIVYVLAAILFAGGIAAWFWSRGESVPVAAALGARAPEFDLEILGKPGERIALKELRGRPVAVIFNCGCKLCYDFNHVFVAAAPKMEELQPIGIMMNHWSYAPDQIRNFRETTKFKWPLLMDHKSQTTITYRSTDCPRVWLIDRKGIIRYHNESNKEDPEKIVRELMEAYKNL